MSQSYNSRTSGVAVLTNEISQSPKAPISICWERQHKISFCVFAMFLRPTVEVLSTVWS